MCKKNVVDFELFLLIIILLIGEPVRRIFLKAFFKVFKEFINLREMRILKIIK